MPPKPHTLRHRTAHAPIAARRHCLVARSRTGRPPVRGRGFDLAGNGSTVLATAPNALAPYGILRFGVSWWNKDTSLFDLNGLCQTVGRRQCIALTRLLQEFLLRKLQ